MKAAKEETLQPSLSHDDWTAVEKSQELSLHWTHNSVNSFSQLLSPTTH